MNKLKLKEKLLFTVVSKNKGILCNYQKRAFSAFSMNQYKKDFQDILSGKKEYKFTNTVFYHLC